MRAAVMRRPRKAAVASGVTDSFNRADSATSLGTADSGQAWAGLNGTWGISSNQAYLASATSQAIAAIDSGLSDGTVTVTMGVIGDAGLSWRVVDASNNFVMGAANGNVYSCVANSYTVLGNIGGRTAGDIIALILSGTSHVVQVNGTTRLSYTNSNFTTAKKHGLRNSNVPAVRFDNFSVGP